LSRSQASQPYGTKTFRALSLIGRALDCQSGWYQFESGRARITKKQKKTKQRHASDTSEATPASVVASQSHNQNLFQILKVKKFYITSLAKLVKQMSSKHSFIGSSPIGCLL
jgi:hypothetical protein